MSIKLFACGDILNFTDNKDWLSDSLKLRIKDCDFSIANFEAPVAHEAMQAIAKAGPHVYQSPNSVAYLKNAGFTHVSLANNHIYDYGELGFKKTLDVLMQQELVSVGAGLTFEDSYQAKIIEKSGIKIGLLAACENEFGCHYDNSIKNSGYAWLFHPRLEDEILNLKSAVDHIVLIAHAGVEEIPIPIKEWRDRYRRLCELGVDVVVGHHPHVPQGYEEYNGSLIFYSLGNFYFDKAPFDTSKDCSFSVVLNFNEGKKIDFECVFHKKINGTTTIVDESDVDFELYKLNDLLKHNYLEHNDYYAKQLFESYYKNYYLSAAGVSFSLIGVAKKFVKLFLGMNKELKKRNGLLLLHNIRIDSHRFTVQRALSLKYEK